MKFPDAVRSGFANYVTFSGRARRSEYWYWTLFCTAIGLVLVILNGGAPDASNGVGLIEILYYLFSVAIFLPGLAVAIRRLHDTNRSGWWYLINLVPLIGSIVLLVFLVGDGTAGPNRFGDDPKGRGTGFLPGGSGGGYVDQAGFGGGTGFGTQLPPYQGDPNDPYRAPGTN